MNWTSSKDGTSIAYERLGTGPALILTGGLLGRSENAPLATELAAHFTVYNYDQRGRGDSGDTLPYAVAREIEDIEAILAVAGGPAHLYGVSAGGALALEAAAAGVAIDRLAVYEVPYGLAGSPERWREYVVELDALLAEGRRGDAFALFMRTAGAPEQDIVSARNSPMWPDLEAVAHTLAYGAACLADGQPPAARLARITRPTLVATGSTIDPHMSRLRADVFAEAADAIAASIPNAHRQTIDGQTHMVDPKALAPVLERFFRQ
ncbi:MAG TPA: alpha/beta hydrolase [Actinoplanes sp.]|nr:alpha/beta hydrolase [Actinoplanes sp.]